MRQEHIHVGHDYALHPQPPHPTTCVRVLTKPAKRRVLVKVVGSDSMIPMSARERGRTLELSTAALSQTWEAWMAGAQEREAARQDAELSAQARWRAQEEEEEEEEAHQLLPDAHRPLPERYEEPCSAIEDVFGDRHRAPQQHIAERLRPFRDLLPHWPATLRRDVLAATETSGPFAAGTVGATMDRFARDLHTASTREYVATYAPSSLPDVVFTFVSALEVEAHRTGVPLLQPWTPTPSQDGASFPWTLGWLQVRVARTSGQNFHAPSCHAMRASTNARYDGHPWWRMSLGAQDRFCHMCLGPDLAHPREVAHLGLAAAVWDARGRTHIEPWQRAAFCLLVGATLAEQAAGNQRVGSKADRIAVKLARTWRQQPTRRTRHWLATGESDPASARRCARRLNTAFKALPKSERPPRLSEEVTASQARARLGLLADSGVFLTPYELVVGRQRDAP